MSKQKHLDFDGSVAFDSEIKPVVAQLLELCRRNHLPLVCAIGISRVSDGPSDIVGDVFETCRITTGSVGKMSGPMLAAGMVLNHDLTDAVRKVVLENMLKIAAAAFTGAGDAATLEATRIIAAYSIMWRIVSQAGVASRPGRGSDDGFQQISHDDMVESGALSREAMDRVLRLMRDMEQHLEETKDDLPPNRPLHPNLGGMDLPPELYNQLRDMFNEGEDKDKE